MTPEHPAYLDLLARASKVRHFLAKNPGSTLAEINYNFHPMKVPIAWLLARGYIIRAKNPNPLQIAPIYSVKPLGVFCGHLPEDMSYLGNGHINPSEDMHEMQDDEDNQ